MNDDEVNKAVDELVEVSNKLRLLSKQIQLGLDEVDVAVDKLISVV